MYEKFTIKKVALKDILLDSENPRIVTLDKLKSQEEIIKYFFEFESLAEFLKKIATEGFNPAEERPYIVSNGEKYIVVEGSTRVATYKLLSGLINPPDDYKGNVPHISAELKAQIAKIDCCISPNRDLLLPIMASAHFGLGDKSKWGYLGSRKAVYDKYISGKTIDNLSVAFAESKSQVIEYILEYKLYLEALKFSWTQNEKAVLLNPSVKFNPPVRFLQSQGHKELMGINMDKVNVAVSFADGAAKDKYKYLIRKLVVTPEAGLGATATYNDVFKDYKPLQDDGDEGVFAQNGDGGTASEGAGIASESANGGDGSATKAAGGGGTSSGNSGSSSSSGNPSKGNVLFIYQTTLNSGLIKQLMKEARELNVKNIQHLPLFCLEIYWRQF